jgi:hypothetical protein
MYCPYCGKPSEGGVPHAYHFPKPPPPPKAAKKPPSKAVIVLVIIGVLAVVGLATSNNKDGGSPGTGGTNNGIDNGLGTKDASADVTLGHCDSSYGVVTCTLNITNHSGGTSDYYIEAELDDDAGTNVGIANALASHVGAGQNAHADLTGVISGNSSNVTVKITEVQRTSS